MKYGNAWLDVSPKFMTASGLAMRKEAAERVGLRMLPNGRLVEVKVSK